MSVPGLLGFTNLAQPRKPAMILTTLLEYPELASVPPPHFVSTLLPLTAPPPSFCQGSLSLYPLLVTPYLARAPKPIRTP